MRLVPPVIHDRRPRSEGLLAMSRHQKLREKILDGRSDANISFHDLRSLLLELGFVERIKGSHHTFRKEGVADMPNLQRDGSKAKSYQVKQIREIMKKNQL